MIDYGDILHTEMSFICQQEGEKTLFGALHCMVKDNFIKGKRLSREHSIQMLLVKITRLGYNEFFFNMWKWIFIETIFSTSHKINIKFYDFIMLAAINSIAIFIHFSCFIRNFNKKQRFCRFSKICLKQELVILFESVKNRFKFQYGRKIN